MKAEEKGTQDQLILVWEVVMLENTPSDPILVLQYLLCWHGHHPCSQSRDVEEGLH